MIYPEIFGVFYDYQAASLLNGRLDVPYEALFGESFVYAGKTYGYFGPTPALLRLPFIYFGVGFGQLSRAFMLADYAACLVAAYFILVHIWKTARAADVHPPTWAVVLLTLNAGLGSTLFFLGSRAYIYHEAILCGVTFALWSCYCTLRYLTAPERRYWLGALLCGTLAVNSRPPVGLFALAFLGFAAATQLWRNYTLGLPNSNPLRAGLRFLYSRHIGIGLLSVLGVLSFNGLSYLKFRTFDGAPLKYHVQYDQARLANIQGKNFHLSNLHCNLDAYFLQPMAEFVPTFPYIYATGQYTPFYPGAKIDLSEPMVSVPCAMPSLCLLAGLGLIVGWRKRALRLSLLSLWLAILPMTLALLAAVATSHRYTADFCPFLFAAAIPGCIVVDDFSPHWRKRSLILLSLLSAIAIYIAAAVAIHYQGYGVWGVPEDVRADYQKLRLRVDRLLHFPPHAPR